MPRKILILIMSLFFIFSQGILAQRNVKKIDHLVWKSSSWEDVFEMYIGDPSLETTFESDKPILKFHVPGTPSSRALFFETWSGVIYELSGLIHRDAKFYVVIKLVSDSIPDNIEILFPFTLYGLTNETNYSGNTTELVRRTRDVKCILMKNCDDYYQKTSWFITYKDGGFVPNNIAKLIVRNLINRGFDVEVNVQGKVQGINHFQYIPLSMEVTRIKH